MSSLREQAEAARYEADREKQRRSMEEFYHHKEENTNLGEDFQKNLSFKTISNQDWRTIIRQECESKRHKVFYKGTPAEKRALSQNNHTHILSIQQIKCIVEQLKRWGSYEDQEYLDQVSIPHSIVAIYANYHKMTYEEANERVSATFVNDSEGLEAEGESEAAQLAKEQKRQEEKAERKAKKVKEREKKQQLAEENERPKFKFSKADSQSKVEEGKTKKEEEKKRKETKLAKEKAEKKKKAEVEKEKKEREKDKRRKEEEKEKICNEKISPMVSPLVKERPRRAETLTEQKSGEPEIPVDETEEAASIGGKSCSRYLTIVPYFILVVAILYAVK